MKALLAILGVIGVVAATPLFGTEQCVKGPPVWCVNIKTAKQCNAVTHCQQTVWNKPVLNSAPCEFCKEAISVVANYLKQNATQELIQSTLEKVCDLVPVPSYASECKELIEEYYQIIIDFIEGEMSNPGAVCCALGLCRSLQQHLASLHNGQLSSNEIPDVDVQKLVSPFLANVPLLLFPQEKTKEKATTDVCQDCLQLVSDVQDTLKSNTSFSKLLIENFLKDCDQFGGEFSDVCKQYVNQYADLGIQMIIQLPAKQICCGLGLCATEKSTPPLEMVPAKLIVPAKKLLPAIKVAKVSEDSLPTCELCKVVIEKLEKILEDNTTETRIKQALDKVCHCLPDKYREKCVDFVEEYCDAIIELIEQEVPPHAVCSYLGCCSKRQPKFVKLDSEKTKDGACEVCKMILTCVESALEDNSTAERIENILKTVCEHLGESMRDECRQIIDLYGPIILQYILDEMRPDAICRQLGICPNTQKPLLGVEKCMWGPSYWCKDLETAGSCNAIEHCKRHVWS